MEKDITLKLEVFSSENDDEHCITSTKEIVSILRNIAKKKSRVALYFGGANKFILTTLLAIDAHGLWLEQSTDSTTNEVIAADHNLIVVGTHYNVKIQFSVPHPKLAEYQNYPAFFVPLPDKLFRLQRREYFRLMTPVANPLKCAIPGTNRSHDEAREVTIMDISSSGIALTCEENNTELLPGDCYSECRIELPEFGTITGTIMVKNLAILTDTMGRSYKRAGCELQNLDNSSAILLHRYVLHLQLVK
jgi:c-di-GMP-binding flagellar brake protein YcgR